MRAHSSGLAPLCIFAAIALIACGCGGSLRTVVLQGSPTATVTPAPAVSVTEVAAPVLPTEAPPAPPAPPPVIPPETPVPIKVPPAPATPVPEQPASPVPTAPPPADSILQDNQLVVYYGTPLASGLGILGTFTPEDAASRVAEHARTYDALNGDGLGAVGALDVIYGLAQGEPTDNGLYVRRLERHHVEQYLHLAEQFDLQVLLDLQIGRAQILDEVRHIEPYLRNPRVHVAIDPEYAVGPHGVPIETPGTISGDEINAVQNYLRDLVDAHDLPPKLLVVHQYMDSTVIDGDAVEPNEEVELVINMDAFGDTAEKHRKYQFFAEKSYSHNDGFNIFLKQDHEVLTETDVLQLSPLPSVIFYQ